MIKNLTPHTINICNEAGEVLVSLPSDGKARVTSKQEVIREHFRVRPADSEGMVVPVVTPPIWGEITGLPWPHEMSPDDVVLVSFIVGQRLAAAAHYNGPRVMSPDTGKDSVVRSSDGQVRGVRRLIRWR